MANSAKSTKEAEVKPVEMAGAVDTKFTKAELLALPTVTGATRDMWALALTDDKKYTYQEAVNAADKYKKGGLF